jgi:hypothetical protein
MNGSFLRGLLAGAAAVGALAVFMPGGYRAVQPAMRRAMKAGIKAYEQGREQLSELAETAEDAYAEAMEELEREAKQQEQAAEAAEASASQAGHAMSGNGADNGQRGADV